MNVEQSVIFHLGSLTKIVNNKANHIFQNAGYHIRIEQVPVLMALFYNGRLSQQEIANIVTRDKSSIQRTVVTLCRNQLIRIDDDVHDKRKNIIVLTESGKKLSQMLQRGMIKLESILFSHIQKSDQDRLIEMIKLIERKISFA
ncbi:MAG: MarR family transcriptional regulator [Taibaiella sp.]|jgi:MarR family transcriptional repressor of mepA